MKPSFIGEKLRLARLFHGFALEDVGLKVGSTRQYIHQLEAGAKMPSREMEEALAFALGVQSEFFSVPVYNAVKVDQCHFRKLRSTPLNLTYQVLARATLLEQLISSLEYALELPTVNFPEIPVEHLSDVEAAAERCRQHWGLGTGGPITNMTRVVENAGAVVTQFDGVTNLIDALSINRVRPLIVRSSVKESLCRLRFDLAHECGHLVMHQALETGDKVTEDQANRFAGAFLLPRHSFIKEFPRGRRINWRVLFEMKLRWKVSVRAIIRRALDLQLIDPGQYKTANIHLTKSGQSKVERYDDELPLEAPELLPTAISTLLEEFPAHYRAVHSYLAVKPSFFELLAGKPMRRKVSEEEKSENIFHIRRYR